MQRRAGFIATAEHDGQRYIVLLDPEAAIRALVARGGDAARFWRPLSEDFETIGLDPAGSARAEAPRFVLPCVAGPALPAFAAKF